MAGPVPLPKRKETKKRACKRSRKSAVEKKRKRYGCPGLRKGTSGMAGSLFPSGHPLKIQVRESQELDGT